MAPDIATRLKDTTPDHVPPLDLDRAVRRGRRTRLLKRAGGGAAGLAIMTVMAAVAAGSPGRPAVEVDDPVASTGATEPTSSSHTESPTADLATVKAAWDDLTLQEAVDRLVARSGRAPQIDLPPPDGQALRTHSLSLGQETGVDVETGTVDASTDTWSLLEEVEVITRDGVGWSQFARESTTRPAGSVDRPASRQLVDELRPEQLGERFRIGADTAVGVDWGRDYDEQAATILERFDPAQWRDPDAIGEDDTAQWRNFERFGHILLDTSARIDLLGLLARAAGVAYEGVVPDLAGRPAIAFSVPFLSSDTDGSAAVREWLLLSPGDGTPVGSERFDPRDERVEWRSLTLLDAQLVPFDSATVEELPAWELSTPEAGDS